MRGSGYRARVSRRTGLWPLVLVAPLLAATCRQARPDALRSADVTARRVEAGERRLEPRAVAVLPGDWVFESEHLRVVVGGVRRGGRGRGAILWAGRRDAPPEDAIAGVFPRLWVGDRSYAVVARRMFLVERGRRPTLRIEGDARVGRRVVDVVRELALGGDGTWLSTDYRVTPQDGEALDHVRAGMRVRWGGARPQAPGVGRLRNGVWHEASWAGASADAVSAAAGFHAAPSYVRASYERHGPTRLSSHTDVASRVREISAATPLRDKATLALAPGGLSEAVRRFGWARGAPYPEVLATLPYAPEGASVVVSTVEGAPIVRGRPDARGQVLLPLSPAGAGRPAAVHELVASAYGHARSDPVRVEAGARAVLRIPLGGRLRVTIADADGGVIPARVRIEGIKETKTPDLGPQHRADGAVDTVLTAEGDIEVPLPVGAYRVLVSHGPEHTLSDSVAKVTETFRPKIEAKIERVVDPGPWVSCDFHLHQAPSYDSQVDLGDRLLSLRAAGVRFAVPTDHNHVTDYGPTIRDLGIDDVTTAPGVEITTWDPQFGHFNAYPFPINPDAPRGGAPSYRKLTPAELFASLRRIDPSMVIQVSHPRLEPQIGYFDLTGFDPATGRATGPYSDDWDVLEVFNGYDIARPDYVQRVLEDWLAILERGQRVVAVGSSDSHQVQFHLAGYPRTYVRTEGGTDEPGAVVAALEAGRAFVSSGPFVELTVEGRGPGDAVAASEGEVEARVVVRAPPWLHVGAVDLHVGAQVVHTIPIEYAPGEPRPVTRLDEVVTLPIDGDTFLLARARTERTHDRFYGRGGVYPEAFTNPIWIDGDGDGQVPWLAGADAGGNTDGGR